MTVSMQSIREQTEIEERERLSPFAAFSDVAQRELELEPCPYRTAFQRDRDRILHSKAFRRLSHKTQVFISPAGDHYRTRLTHSLEVAQIARTVARALKLNEDLTEAIALGHDLGHPPFGHTGESVLEKLSPAETWHHELHSVRIVTVLEPLNLTHDVLEGMAGQLNTSGPKTLEAQVVKITDRMTYLHHDMEDATRSGLLDDQVIPDEIIAVLGQTRTERLNTMIQDLIEQSRLRLSDHQNEVAMSKPVERTMNQLRKWMYDHVYLSPAQTDQREKVARVLQGLYVWYVQNPQQLPTWQAEWSEYNDDMTVSQHVMDFLAGMTDRYAIDHYQQMLLPRPYRSRQKPEDDHAI